MKRSPSPLVAIIMLVCSLWIGRGVGTAQEIPVLAEVPPHAVGPGNSGQDAPPASVQILPSVSGPTGQVPEATEAAQVLFCVDDSASMSERGFDPLHPLTSRWEIARQAFSRWVETLDSHTRIGIVSVGGDCGSRPSVELSVGTERHKVVEALQRTTPHGNTNLNAVLKRTPELFSKEVKGSRRIVLLSDGLNTCPPQESTCEIVRILHRDHGIIVDVVAFVTDPKMVPEFQCVAAVSGGTFYAPSTLKELLNLPLFAIDPWRYIVLVLGLMTLLPAARIFYGQTYHVVGWGSRLAVLTATAFFMAGGLTLYGVLFAGTTIPSAILGLLTSGTTGALLLRKEPVSRGEPTFTWDA